MTNIYNSQEWKVKRNTRIEGKSCELCGSTECLQVHHTNVSKDEYTMKEHELVQALIKRKVDAGEIPQCSGRHAYYIGKEAFREFWQKNKQFVEDELARLGYTHPDYLDLDKDTIILCRRCHFAISRGLELCPLCKKHYKRPNHETCQQCIPEERKQQIKERQNRRRRFFFFIDDEGDEDFGMNGDEQLKNEGGEKHGKENIH